MRRAWPWLLVLVALAGMGVLVGRPLLEGAADGERAGSPEGPAGTEAASPSLVGTPDARVPVMAPPYLLHGRVHDADGHGVTGVRVVARRPPETGYAIPDLGHQLDEGFRPAAAAGRPAAETTTGADGLFRLDGLDVNEGYWIHALPTPPLVGGVRYAPRGQGRLGPVLLGILPGHALDVRVVDGVGEGLIAEVSAFMIRGVMSARSPSGRLRVEGLRTATDGRLRIPALPPGSVLLDVRLPGRVRRYFPATLPHEGELLLRLFEANGATVAGTVKDADGRPIEGAELLVTATSRGANEPPGAYGMTTSAADGTWRVADLPPVTFDGVVARATGFLLQRHRGGNVRLRAGRVHTVELVLLRGTLLRGRVHGPQSEPLEGVRVHVRSSVSGHGTTKASVTDGEGRFEAGPVPAGTVTVNAYLDGWVQPGGSITKVDGERKTLTIDVPLLPGVPLGGRAIDATGRPVPFAHVTATRSREPQTRTAAWVRDGRFETTADEEGVFRFEGLAPGERWVLRAVALGLQGSTVLEKPLAKDAAPDVEILLRATAGIAGRVVDASGAPVGQVRVDLTTRGSRVETDDEGAFVFQGLEAGTYTLEVHPRSGSVALMEPRVVALTGGETRKDLVLEVATPRPVSGRLTDEAGAPVLGAGLRLRVGTAHVDDARTGEDGRFTMRTWHEGPHRILYGGLPLRSDVEPPATGLELVLPSGTQDGVTFRIVGPDDEPVPRVRMIVRSSREGSSRRKIHEIDGGVVVVPRHDLTPPIQIEIDRMRDALGRPANLLEARRAFAEVLPEEVVVRLLQGRRLSGTVLTLAGNAIEGITVQAGQAERRGRGKPATTDAQGRFEVVGLPEGELWATPSTTAEHARWLPPKPTTVAPDQTEVHFRLARGADLVVRVLDPEEQPVPGAFVGLLARQDDKAWRRTGETDAEGVCRMEGVARDARFELRIRHQGQGPAFPELALEDVPYGTGEIVVRTVAGVQIEGVVVDEAGNPVEDASVHARGLGGLPGFAFGRTEEGSNGFSLGPLEPGRYTVTASAHGRYVDSLPIEVDAPARDLRLVVRESLVLEGRIVGDRADGVLIMWWSHGSTTSNVTKKDGGFAFARVADQTGTLLAQDFRTNEAAILEDVEPSEGPFVMPLRPGRTIAGRIEGFPPDARRDMALVFLRDHIRLGCGVRADDTFEQPRLPAGRWRVELRIGGGFVAEADDIEAGRTDLVLVVERAEEGD